MAGLMDYYYHDYIIICHNTTSCLPAKCSVQTCAVMIVDFVLLLLI